MSGYEKYVAQAADEIQRVVYGTVARTLTGEREDSTEAALAALAVVGPLIEEDTRDRMVTAAGRALEMDVSHKPDGLYYCATSGEIEQYPGGGFDVCCALGPAGHEPISEIAFKAVSKQVAEQIAATITKAGDERSPDRHHGNEEKSDHGSTRYASYLDAARIAREVATP